jgi:hypothetical protein
VNFNPNQLKCQLFADRGDNITEAMAYAYTLIGSIAKKDQAAAYTALHVVLNTVANNLDQLNPKRTS